MQKKFESDAKNFKILISVNSTFHKIPLKFLQFRLILIIIHAEKIEFNST